MVVMMRGPWKIRCIAKYAELENCGEILILITVAMKELAERSDANVNANGRVLLVQRPSYFDAIEAGLLQHLGWSRPKREHWVTNMQDGNLLRCNIILVKRLAYSFCYTHTVFNASFPQFSYEHSEITSS